MDYNIGNMTEQITIQRLVEVRSTTTGGYTKGWTDYLADIWAERIDQGGSEKDGDGDEVAESKVQWRIWYDSGVGQRMRVMDADQRVYDIIHVKTESHKKFTILETTTTNIMDTTVKY